MKHKIWINHLIGAVFAVVLSVSAVGNLVTGYDLEVKSLLMLFLFCATCSFLSALLFRFKHGGALLLFMTALLSWKTLKEGILWDQVQSLACLISKHYHEVYDWPVVGQSLSETVDLPLMVLALWASFSVSWTVCRREHIVFLMPPVIFPLMICLVTTDRVPDPIFLYLLILGLSLLLITDWTRRNHPGQGIRLTLRFAIPIAAALALLFAANPRDEYVNNVGKYQKEVVSLLQKLQDTTEYISSSDSFESAVSEKLNLRNVGPKSTIPYAAMRVTSPIGGTVYLRGRDYDKYSGTGWESSVNRTEVFPAGGRSLGELIIVTYGVRNVLYVPYYPGNDMTLVNGVVSNEENLQRYCYSLCQPASGDPNELDYSYTALPEETLQWVSQLDIIQEIKDAPQGEKLQRIERYVENCAIYDLDTPRMDSEHQDFAQWFLNESDTGYCVHFATAATVLLRGAGIPARYVEGYMVTCGAGEDVVVSSLDAHAWAEYYDTSTGIWKILEATPSDPLDEEEIGISLGTLSEETAPHLSATEEAFIEAEPFSSEDSATTEAEDTEQVESHDSVSDDIGDSTTHKEPFRLPEWLKTLFWIVVLAASVPIQSKIRMEWKRSQWNRGKSNEKAIIRWKQTKRFARLVDVPFPEELENLAQKAIFSQHRIQTNELQLFESYLDTLLEAAKSKPWYHRILLRWIFAIGS